MVLQALGFEIRRVTQLFLQRTSTQAPRLQGHALEVTVMHSKERPANSRNPVR